MFTFLFQVTLSGMPDHLIVLKRGSPIMLLTNLDQSNGHVNGARYVVMDFSSKIIHALGIGETNKGKILLIPRIRFQPEDTHVPFEMERYQFPVRACFSMTSNKAQGQTLKIVEQMLLRNSLPTGNCMWLSQELPVQRV